MTFVGRTVGLAVFAVVILALATTLVTLQPRDVPAYDPVFSSADGRTPDEPFGPSDVRGRDMVVIADQPLVLLRLPASEFDDETLSWTLEDPHDDSLRLVAYQAKSPFLGCNVGWLGTLFDGRGGLIDQCHQGQWDPYKMAAPRPGTPTRGEALPIYSMLWMDGPDGRVLAMQAR